MFKKYFEYYVELITNETLKEAVKMALRQTPDYFWTKGNYGENTPADERARHGMLRRVAKGAYYAKALLRAWELIEHQDIIIAAALLHDCRKYDSESTSQHGPTTAEWLESIWKEDYYSVNLSELEHPLELVLDIIRKHDGRRWSKEKMLPPMGSQMQLADTIAWLIHSCEFIASRTKSEFVWE